LKRTLIVLGVGLPLLALAAGIGYAATQGASSGSGWVTQRGTFTVPVGQTVGDALPLTGITVSGWCELLDVPEPENDILRARGVFEAASGKTMDAFSIHQGSEGEGGTVGGTVLRTYLGTSEGPPLARVLGAATVVATSNDAVATVTLGGASDWAAQTCTFLWQAVEVAAPGTTPPGEPVPVTLPPGGEADGGG
jgi:hypothetical protein